MLKSFYVNLFEFLQLPINRQNTRAESEKRLAAFPSIVS